MIYRFKYLHENYTLTLLNKISIAILLISIHGNATAQKLRWLRTENDTAYILDLTNDLTIRTYFANKTTRYVIGDYSFYRKLAYQANDNYNIGLGFNYKYIGLNLGFKLPFVNEDTRRYGKTKFFDLQSFIYLRKVTIDLYCLSHHGYYLASRSMIHTPGPSNIFPQRPDLHVTNIGLNAQYIFNEENSLSEQHFCKMNFKKGAPVHLWLVRVFTILLLELTPPLCLRISGAVATLIPARSTAAVLHHWP